MFHDFAAKLKPLTANSQRKYHMARRRRRTKSVVRVIAIGVLILWVGLLLIGILGHDKLMDHDNPTDLGPSTRIIKPELDSQQVGKAQGRTRLLVQRNKHPLHNSSSRNSKAKEDLAASPDTSTRTLARELPPPAPARQVPPPAPIRSVNLAGGGPERSGSPDKSTVAATDASEFIGEAEPEQGKPSDWANIAGNDVFEPAAEMKRRRQANNDATEPLPRSDVAPLVIAPGTSASVSSSNVARAQFTTGIEAREPIDKVASVFSTNGKSLTTLYYFTELVNMNGETVTHRWMHDGAIVAEIPFRIGGDRWRVYSSKDLTRVMEGSWQVIVTDTQGDVIRTDSFTYQGS
jgi:hypothetical protein